MGYHYYRVSELSVYRIWQAAENKVVITIHVLGKSNPSRLAVYDLGSFREFLIANDPRTGANCIADTLQVTIQGWRSTCMCYMAYTNRGTYRAGHTTSNLKLT